MLNKLWFTIDTDDGRAISIAENFNSGFILYRECLGFPDKFDEYYFDDYKLMSGFIFEMNESDIVIVPGHWLAINYKYVVFVKIKKEYIRV